MTEPLNDDEMAAAMAGAITEMAAARGQLGLAKEPERWCHDESFTLGGGSARLYRSIAQPSEWVMLVGDAGMSIGAQPLLDLGKSSKAKVRASAALFTNDNSSTRVVALFNGLPPADNAVGYAMPVLLGQRQGMFSISTGASTDASKKATGNRK